MTAMQSNKITESKTGRALQPFLLLFPSIRRYQWQMAGALAAVSVAAGTVLAFGWGLKHLIDQGFADKSGAYLNQALLVLLVVILVLAASSYTRFYLVYWVTERAIADLRKKIYRHLLSLDAAYFETQKSGEQVSHINTDTTVLQMVMTTNVPMAFRHVMTLLGGMVMLFVVSPVMTSLVLLGVPFVIAPIVFFGKKVRAQSRETQGRVGAVAALAQETIQGIQTIQSFGYEGKAAEAFSFRVEDIFKAALNYAKVRAFLTALVIAVVFGAIGLVLWAGGHKVLNGQISAGELSAFVFYAVIVAGAAGALSEAMSAFSQALGAADRITAVLLQKPALKNSDSTAVLSPTLAGTIRFEDVNFRYPTRPEQLALDAVSFEIAAGSVVALVGASGAGKTTVFQLLQRFYDPEDGKIMLGGVDSCDFKPSEIRNYFGVVSQDPAIFSSSIADNIRVAKPDASDAEVQRAAEQAQAHEFILGLPQGYQTLVGERGSRLSGGQKQRLAIARAVLKNPKVLLLDEATSALDSSNEHAVMIALKNLMQGRTVLIIAHRLSTIQNADKIIVLDKGKIVGEGTHDALYGDNTLYTHLARWQMSFKGE
jgi:ATP-binding cassette subfamily B protein